MKNLVLKWNEVKGIKLNVEIILFLSEKVSEKEKAFQ